MGPLFSNLVPEPYSDPDYTLGVFMSGDCWRGNTCRILGRGSPAVGKGEGRRVFSRHTRGSSAAGKGERGHLQAD